jgi:hypothetical protein
MPHSPTQYMRMVCPHSYGHTRPLQLVKVCLLQHKGWVKHSHEIHACSITVSAQRSPMLYPCALQCSCTARQHGPRAHQQRGRVAAGAAACPATKAAAVRRRREAPPNIASIMLITVTVNGRIAMQITVPCAMGLTNVNLPAAQQLWPANNIRSACCAWGQQQWTVLVQDACLGERTLLARNPAAHQ